MRSQLLVCLVLATFLFGQTPQSVSPPAAPPSGAGNPAAASMPATPAPAKVGPDDTVLTIKGYCADTKSESDSCKMTVTKSQFEKLADTLQPGMSPAMRRQLASAYARMLTMSAAAEKRGLDKTPHFEEAMNFARMQILAQELSKTFQADSGKVTDEDIQDYYQKNANNFQQATFVRIFVPHTKRFVTAPPTPAKKGTSATSKTATSSTTKPAAPAAKKLTPEEQEKAGEAAMKKEADLLRAELVKGDDPDKLEKQAFTAGNLPGAPPSTKMENIRRSSLPADHQVVFDLKPGEVSPVISDPSGNYIYKLISKDTVPLDKVKNEIHNQLASQRYRENMQHFQNNADLNDAYFGPPRGPGMPMPPHGPKPPAQQGENDPD